MATAVKPALNSRPGLLSPQFILGLAIGLALLSYIQLWRFDFVYDDHPQIENNIAIRTWSHLPGYFTSHLWANAANQIQSNYYRPMFLMWLRCNYALFGIQPAYWHTASLALHLVVIWLVYLATIKLLQLAGWQQDTSRMPAAITALLFGLHPVHVESVAWVSATSELLLTIFLLAAFVFYAKVRVCQKKAKWIAGSLTCFALALLTKETAIVFPATILACELLLPSHAECAPGKRIQQAVKAMLPWAVVLAGYFLVRRLALGELVHPQIAFSRTTILESIPGLLWFYVRHLLWPYPLALFYDVHPVESWRSVEFLMPAICVLGIVVVGWIGIRHSRALAFAICWTVLPLLPVLNVSLMRKDAWVADRYLYLPSFGFCLFLALAFDRLISAQWLKRWGIVPLAVVAAAMGGVTGREAAAWENDRLAFENAFRIAPKNPYAETNLALQMMDRGENDRALQLLQDSYQRDPNSWLTAFNLAYLYWNRADLRNAEHWFERSIELDSHNKNQFHLLALTEKRLGKLGEAESMLRKTIAIWPEAPFVHSSLGEVLEQQGRYDEALWEFSQDLAASNPIPARRAIARVAEERTQRVSVAVKVKR